MGSCGAKEKERVYDEKDLASLIKIQNYWRKKIAIKKRNEMKKDALI